MASVAYISQTKQRQLEFDLQWRGVPQSAEAPPFLKEFLGDQHLSSAPGRRHKWDGAAAGFSCATSTSEAFRVGLTVVTFVGG
jgi:hypothetical protein